MKDGDIIRSVNRISLESPESVMRVYNQVIESNRATVEVTRNGRRVNLTYRVEG